jgi:RHS repeat-associated protein
MDIENSAAAFEDTTVHASTAYTYNIYAIDFHHNLSTPTALSVTTPSANAGAPLQRGIRPTNTYWGGAGEQIDIYNGNLTYSVPLITAIGRGGLTANFKLVYNSENWVGTNNPTAFTETMDTGYGFGWQLMLGSIMPVVGNSNGPVEYWYTDSSGAQYRMLLNNVGVWTGNASFYAWFDTNTNRLRFRDGTFWLMGCVSAGGEPDAGTLYPTLIEDSNGNQIIIHYMAGAGANWADSSARISSIEDARAVSYTDSGSGDTLYHSYSFSYTTANGLSYLSSITSYVNTPENYTFTINTGQPIYSPWGVSFSTTSLLTGITFTGLGYSYNFTYDTSLNDGDLTQVQFPQGGHLRWAYENCTYTGPQTIREVQYRYLLSNTSKGEDTYTFTPGNGASTTLDDPTGAERYWVFSSGWLSEIQYRPSHGVTPIRHEYYTWTQDPTSQNFYLSNLRTVLDENQLYSQTTQTAQNQDSYGNVTSTTITDYGGTQRIYSNAYLYKSNSNYVPFYIYNRLLTSTLTSVTPNLTLVSNTYDGGTSTATSSLPREWDSNYNTSFAYRGNVTQTVTPGRTINTKYDTTGTVVSQDDNNGHSVAITTSTATNFTQPDKLDPNSTGLLVTQLTYSSPSLGPASTAAPGQTIYDPTSSPNGTAPYTHYDTYGRVDYTLDPSQTAGAAFGAKTTYTYGYTSGAWTITGTSPTSGGSNHFTTTTLDGIGRAVSVQSGYSSTVVSTVDTTYAPCACSPLGKMSRQSQPYGPNDTEVYTNYTYDALGRTLTVTLPDGNSKSQYTYQGNATTLTDPAGKWKQYFSDAFGNLVTVLEPDPTATPVPGPPNPPPSYPVTSAPAHMLLTSYTFDQLNHLTQVSMPRSTGTQTRTFNYDAATQRLMSVIHPENGTVSYTYNADGTLASKTDAKGNKETYGYDTYQRRTAIHRFPGGVNEDPAQLQTFTYDSNSWGSYPGQLATATFASGIGPNNLTFQYEYGYTPSGKINNLSLIVQAPSHTPGSANVTYTYDSHGMVTYMAVQGVGYWYTLNNMEQQVGLGDTGLNWGSNATYNAAGQLTGATFRSYGPGVTQWTETRSFNAMQQLTRIQQVNSNNSAVLMDMTYNYPAAPQNNGQVSSTVDAVTRETIAYHYDALKRLASASSNRSWSETYTFDGFGNLTQMTPTGGAPALSVSVDATTNRIQPSGVQYDADGNTTAWGGSYQGTYDVANRLVSVNGTSAYVYDPSNQRVYCRNSSGTEVGYLYGAFGEKLGAGTISVYSGSISVGVGPANVYFAGRVIEDMGNPVGIDRLGSVGWGGPNATGYQAHYPYGVEYTVTANDRQKYATYTRDSLTGLDYAVNRYYSSQWGRFLSPDPYGGSASLSNPQTWNRYSYVAGDPISGIDPLGLCAITYLG